MKFCVVYRYIDLKDNITKYIGIITSKSKNRCLEDRLKEHNTRDKWAKGNYRIEYFLVKSRTDAEAFESHLIAYYKTYEYHNKAKKDWGLSAYLPTNIDWKFYITYEDSFTQNKNRRNCETQYSFIPIKKPKIWKGKNGKWYAYIPDTTKERGYRLVKRVKKVDLENILIDRYGK